MQNAGLDEAQAGIKIAGRNINNLRYADDTTLMADSEEEDPGHKPRLGLFCPEVTLVQSPAPPRNPNGRLDFKAN